MANKAVLNLAFVSAVGITECQQQPQKAAADKLAAPDTVTATTPVVSTATLDTTLTFAADSTELAQRKPELAGYMATLAQLPLMGKYIYDILKNPTNGIRVSLSYALSFAGVNAGGIYEEAEGTLKVVTGIGTTIFSHESFNAAQNMHEGKPDVYGLTERDAAVALFLKDAAAAAYELVTTQEALNRGVPYQTYTCEGAGASDNENIDAFNAAYAAAFKKHENADANLRESKSLEAGGGPLYNAC